MADTGVEHQELAIFIEQHHPRLIRLAALICVDRSDAEDAVQNALERAWRARDELRDPDRVAAWLDRIVVREAIRIRHRPRFRAAASRWGDREPLAPGLEAADTIALRSAFADLPGKLRTVVVLHHYAGYSVPETAALMDVPLETARSRLRLARDRLHVALQRR